MTPEEVADRMVDLWLDVGWYGPAARNQIAGVIQDTRNEALEEAAKVAEAELDEAWKGCQPVCIAIAEAIRALKSPVSEGGK